MPPTELNLSAIWADILGVLPHLGVDLVILIIAYLLAVWATKGLEQALRRRGVDRQHTLLPRLFARVAVLALGRILALGQQVVLGRFSSLIAGLGVSA